MFLSVKLQTGPNHLMCLNAIIIYNSKHAKTKQALTEPWGMVSLKTLNKYLSNDIALLQDGQSMYWCLLLGFCLKHEYHVRWIIRGYKKKKEFLCLILNIFDLLRRKSSFSKYLKYLAPKK